MGGAAREELGVRRLLGDLPPAWRIRSVSSSTCQGPSTTIPINIELCTHWAMTPRCVGAPPDLLVRLRADADTRVRWAAPRPALPVLPEARASAIPGHRLVALTSSTASGCVDGEAAMTKEPVKVNL